MFTKFFHNKLVYSRRMTRLAELISNILNGGGYNNILDVGCGDGRIDSYLMRDNKEIKISGIDVLVRPDTFIKVTEYDGHHIPMEDNSVDAVMVIDVLHHVDDPKELMKEMTRVASQSVIIKDHIKTGLVSYLKLRLMDYVGNAHHHVRLPYNYLTKKQWDELFKENGLEVQEYLSDLHLYTGLFHLLFDRNLHFIVKLKKRSSPRGELENKYYERKQNASC
ncbi:MAG: methyltransferase domain-containing protein [Treponemataceae bacterium]|nr:methyltransferase domain-containing protein [Treponemataceae bacterium]